MGRRGPIKRKSQRRLLEKKKKRRKKVMQRKKVSLLFTFLVPLLLNAGDRGISKDRILFGQTAVFSGPNRSLGEFYQNGILAAFQEINQKGGVGGRKLELRSLDDGYEPEQALANTKKFLKEDDVFAIIGGVGTPTAHRILPVLQKGKIPFVGPFTGAEFLYDRKTYDNVINLRASYLDELKASVKHSFETLGKRRFGIIYQDDNFGRYVFQAYKKVLDSYGLPILAKTTHSRNAHAVHSSLFTVAKFDLDTVLVVGSYAANSSIINMSRSLGDDYVMLNLSFVLSRSLRERLQSSGKDIYVTEVVPNPMNRNLRVVQRFQRAMKDYRKNKKEKTPVETYFNEVSLEGYILGRYVSSVLDRMDGELTRGRFMAEGLSLKPFHIDDWTIQFKPGTNGGSEYIRLIHLGDTGDGVWGNARELATDKKAQK